MVPSLGRTEGVPIRGLRICTFETAKGAKENLLVIRTGHGRLMNLPVFRENSSNPHYLGHYHQDRELSGHLRLCGLIFKTNLVNI